MERPSLLARGGDPSLTRGGDGGSSFSSSSSCVAFHHVGPEAGGNDALGFLGLGGSDFRVHSQAWTELVVALSTTSDAEVERERNSS